MRRTSSRSTRLLASADAVVWSRGSAVAELAALAPDELHRRHPQLTVTAITPFGLDGPWHDRPATEFTLQAWSGGIVGLGPRHADRAPVHVGGQVGDWLCRCVRAAMTLAFRARALRDGHGNSSTCRCWRRQILCLTYYPGDVPRDARPAVARRARRLTVPGRRAGARTVWSTLGCGTAQQWFDLCAMIGPRRLDRRGLAAVDHRAGQRARRGALRVAARARPSTTIRDLAIGVPHPERPGGQRRERRRPSITSSSAGRSSRNPRDGFVQPGHPYRMQRRHAARARHPRPGSASTPRSYRPKRVRRRSQRP